MDKETYQFTRQKIREDRRAAFHRLALAAAAAGVAGLLTFVANSHPFGVGCAMVFFGWAAWRAQT